jgi:hypothetical protein
LQQGNSSMVQLGGEVHFNKIGRLTGYPLPQLYAAPLRGAEPKPADSRIGWVAWYQTG